MTAACRCSCYCYPGQPQPRTPFDVAVANAVLNGCDILVRTVVPWRSRMRSSRVNSSLEFSLEPSRDVTHSALSRCRAFENSAWFKSGANDDQNVASGQSNSQTPRASGALELRLSRTYSLELPFNQPFASNLRCLPQLASLLTKGEPSCRCHLDVTRLSRVKAKSLRCVPLRPLFRLA